jgi:integrase
MSIQASCLRANSGFHSREGYYVRLHERKWKLNKDVEIPIIALKSLLSEEVYLSLRSVLAFYAGSSSPSHVQNLFYRSKYYLESTAGQIPFSVESLISYRAALDVKQEWYVATLRGLIRQWDRLGFPGISADVLRLLDTWRLRGNDKGYAVQSMCPDNGPFTDIEIEGVIAAVIREFASNNLPLVDACYTLMLAMTGRRRSQITALKLKDLVRDSDRYFISFPRAKQRHQNWRSTFSRFAIIEDLWVLLQRQAADVESLFAKKLGRKVSHKLVGELPLFPFISALDINLELAPQLVSDNLHAPSVDVNDSMVLVAKKIKVFSERTGRLLQLNPSRFRYTLGTNLAREGKGEFVIAEALDHSDTQNAGIYVKNIPEIVERIDKAVALELAPIAQAFQGMLVVSERNAERGNDPTSRIGNGTVDLGTCGSYGFCGAIAPIACYTCNYFQPWLNGPHEAVLDELIRRRDTVLECTNDRKIASINDRVILAVGDVVHRCKTLNRNSTHG